LPPTSAESLVAIDASTGREAPETELCLTQVAARLNRLAVLRAVFRAAAVVLLAASTLAACAAWLSPAQFRVALALLGLIAAALLALSAHALHAGWAGALEAARWVEHKISLEQRLLTLVSASREGPAARLWPELIADNQAQLPRWRQDRLGIAPLPANVLLLLLALVAAWLFLVPYGDTGSRPEIPGATVAAPHGEDSTSGAGGKTSPAGPGAQAQLQGGTKGGEGPGAGPQGKVEGAAATGTLDQVQSELASNFERSLGGSAMLQSGSGKPGDGDQAQGQRDAVAESGLGKSNAEAGGRVPDETLARREQDDGTGQAVQQRNGGEGAAKARPGGGERGRPSDPSGQPPAKGGAQAGGRPVRGGNEPADGPLALGDEEGKKSHSGGAGAGSGKATEALLAKSPLTLNGGRQTAHFSLTLGGASGKADSDGPRSIVAQPRSRIADVERGAQEADRAVRHEEIPAEYETAVKRVFKREP
jgi:hypothetical protein